MTSDNYWSLILHSSEGGIIPPPLPLFAYPPFFQNCAIPPDNDGMGGVEVKFWTFEREGEGDTKIEQVWRRGERGSNIGPCVIT